MLPPLVAMGNNIHAVLPLKNTHNTLRRWSEYFIHVVIRFQAFIHQQTLIFLSNRSPMCDWNILCASLCVTSRSTRVVSRRLHVDQRKRRAVFLRTTHRFRDNTTVSDHPHRLRHVGTGGAGVPILLSLMQVGCVQRKLKKKVMRSTFRQRKWTAASPLPERH